MRIPERNIRLKPKVKRASDICGVHTMTTCGAFTASGVRGGKGARGERPGGAWRSTILPIFNNAAQQKKVDSKVRLLKVRHALLS
jgi:hypothetical protein